MRSFIILVRAELLNIFGINVFRHTKDPADKKRRMMLLIAYIFAVAVLGAYLALSAYGIIRFGAARFIPALFPLLSVVFCAFFGAFRARGSLYRTSDLDLLSALPLKGGPIAAARMVRMYAENLMLTCIIVLPAMVMYGISQGEGIVFCVLIPAILFLAMLPTLLSAWVGMAFAAVIARARHKVLAEVLMAVAVVAAGVLAMPLLSTGSAEGIFGMGDMTALSSEEMNERIGEMIAKAAEGLEENSPALLAFGEIFNGRRPLGILIFAAVVTALTVITALAIGGGFFRICAGLRPVSCHEDYRPGRLREETSFRALVRKEAGRYFSSGIYVSNTIIGPVILVAMSIALCFISPGELLKKVGELPADIIYVLMPFLLSLPVCLMSITASSVSLEGRNWWIVKSLPISAREILNAKLAFALLVFLPFYVLSELILLFSTYISPAIRMWIIILPFIYIVFGAVWGLFINLKLPKLHWGNDTEVVKQSAAVGVSMLAIFAVIIPAAVLCIIPFRYLTAGFAAVTAILGCASILLYRRIMAADLKLLN